MESINNSRKNSNYRDGQQHTFLKHVFSMKVDGFFRLDIDKNEVTRILIKFDLISILKKFVEVYRDKYDYRMVDSKSWSNKCNILCKQCGEFFETTVTNHYYNGIECVKCYGCIKSKGERRINDYLKSISVSFKREYVFEDLSGHRFDLYIPERNLLIEYDGEQHFKAIDYFGGKQRFEIQKMQDQIKNKYANKKGIRLLRIPYNKRNNIEKILNEII